MDQQKTYKDMSDDELNKIIRALSDPRRNHAYSFYETARAAQLELDRRAQDSQQQADE